MGKSSKSRRKPSPDTDPSSSPPPPASSLSPSTSSSDDYETTTSSKRRRRSSRRSRDSDGDDNDFEDEVYRRRSSSSSKKDKAGRKKKRKREKSRSRSEKRGRDRDRDRDRDRERRRKKERNRRSRSESKRSKASESESGSSLGSSAEDYSDPERNRFKPEDVVRDLFEAFPGVADDLKQLLQMIDSGQAVDIKGVSEKALMKHLQKLFLSLNLKETGDRVFLLRSNAQPTLEIVGPIISSQRNPQGTEPHSEPPNVDSENSKKQDKSAHLGVSGDVPGPKRRVMGPEMPSAELLAAAAKLTEAEAELRDAELDHDDDLFVGPPPPAVVTEAESSNEAERFEEVTRIIAAEVKSPYDILGVNHKMSTDNIKKKYWRLSLMVHPDKCSHPEANQAFIKLNRAFKDLQDPDKRKAIDDEIKKKEEEEEMKVGLKSMREAALWRRSQGISMEGDDILLAELDVKGPPQRDEWMTTLPPERKPAAMSMHSTFFSKSGKEGRGDTSIWTDTPSDRAQKAKMNYLEAYNQATALAANEDDKKRANNADAVLVDQYNKAKRSKSLIEKHREEEAEKRKKKKNKAKQPQNRKEAEQGEWVGNHPWKPWDREKDLTAGRQSVKLDSETMGDGLSSRFSSGNFQRSFL